MKAILDAHALLWFLAGDDRLSSTAKSAILTPANELWVSAATLWEIAIKVSLGKLELAQPLAQLLPDQLERNAVGLLAIRLEHLVMVAELPFHHRDPFDRLMVAQALVDQLVVVSNDAALDAYGITRTW